MTDSILSPFVSNVFQSLKNYNSHQSILPFIPKPVKWALLLLLLLNGRNFPLLWHARLFRFPVCASIYHRFTSRLGYESKAQKRRRLLAISFVGDNPFNVRSTYTGQAVIPVCDYNFHLSNTSYAVALDCARAKFTFDKLPLLYPDGGQVVLAGVCLNFIKEIPINSKYEVITKVGSWDNKWASAPRINCTCSTKAKDITDTSRAMTFGEPFPPNAVIHCTAVSRACFKLKRITIPPVIVMACMGYQMIPSKYAEILSWRTENGQKGIREFYAGGWKSVPEGERWWEDAFKDIEPERIRRLTAISNATGLPQAT